MALAAIARTLSLIENRDKTPPDLSKLTLNDPETYCFLSSGDITGLFLPDSHDIKNLLIRCRPECFEELAALLALDRPGPLESGMTDDFVERRRGLKEIEYTIPELEPILKETYGILVYQEQVMKIANVLANYTMPEGDDFRKAMGKQIPAEVLEHKLRIIKGMGDHDIPSDKAGRVLDFIAEYGGFGFRRSHIVKYALLTYQTAYLKAHYPEEFAEAWGE